MRRLLTFYNRDGGNDGDENKIDKIVDNCEKYYITFSLGIENCILTQLHTKYLSFI